jgi:hypothetical protein
MAAYGHKFAAPPLDSQRKRKRRGCSCCCCTLLFLILLFVAVYALAYFNYLPPDVQEYLAFLPFLPHVSGA